MWFGAQGWSSEGVVKVCCVVLQALQRLRVLREGRVLGLGLTGSTKCRGSCMMFNKLRGMFWMFRHLEKFREALKKLVKDFTHHVAF